MTFLMDLINLLHRVSNPNDVLQQHINYPASLPIPYTLRQLTLSSKYELVNNTSGRNNKDFITCILYKNCY
jgi:hypothetical protein